MDEFMCSDVVHGCSSGVDDFRATSAGASTFKWFLGHLVEAHFALSCSYKLKSGGQKLQKGMFWIVNKC